MQSLKTVLNIAGCVVQIFRMDHSRPSPESPLSPPSAIESGILDLVEPGKPSHDDIRVTHIENFESEDDSQHRGRTSKHLRKIDLHLLPFLIVMYLLNFLDRSNLAQARQGTLEKDLGMKGTDYNLATGVFFVGYLLMQLPSNMLITRVPPSLFLSIAMTLWGVVSTCNAATHSFGQLIAVRFLLGFVEEGTITIGLAIFSGFVLPNYPATTPWLTDEEKNFAAWRLLADVNEEDKLHDQTIVAGLKLALRDYRLYLFVLFQHISLLSQTFQYFFPAIVGTLGYGSINTLWLTAPVWFATFLVSLLVTWTSSRTKDRSMHIICLMLVAAVGNAIAVGTTNLGARFFAIFLMPMGAVSAYQIVISWVANSFPRPLVKRSVSIAIANMIGNTSSIYGSYMYPSSASPRYIPGGVANTVICLLVALLALVLRLIHIKENRKLEILERELAVDERGQVRNNTGGDKMAVGFRRFSIPDRTTSPGARLESVKERATPTKASRFSPFAWSRLSQHLQQRVLSYALLPDGLDTPISIGVSEHRTHLNDTAVPIFLALGSWEAYNNAASIFYQHIHINLTLCPTSSMTFLTSPPQSDPAV
ncbi:hypothetical protein SLS53_006906 [Cytospora paraplurivora]|uniref:Major facilitator superfamily (MFS) profile domain-containing protein n=1 Tax=Cytospora paraplurivora TaxID=2898453 RepID=A0AAN9U1G8_9PEZI